MLLVLSPFLPSSLCQLSPAAFPSSDTTTTAAVTVRIRHRTTLILLHALPCAQLEHTRLAIPRWVADRLFNNGEQPTDLLLELIHSNSTIAARIADRVTVSLTSPTRHATSIHATESFSRALHGRPIQKGHLFAHVVRGRELVFCVEDVTGSGTDTEGVWRVDVSRTKFTFSPSTFTAPSPFPSLVCVGADCIVEEVRSLIADAFDNVQIHRAVNVPITRSAFISGPSGSGKWSVVRTACRLLSAQVYELSFSAALVVAEHSETATPSRAILTIRKAFQKAKANRPSVIVVRDTDSLSLDAKTNSEKRNEIVDEFIRQVSRIQDEDSVFVVCFTRDRARLPEILRKPEYFPSTIAMSVPDRKQRREILLAHLSELFLKRPEIDPDQNPPSPKSIAELFADRLAQMTPGYLPAGLAEICRQGALAALCRKTGSLIDQAFGGTASNHGVDEIGSQLGSLKLDDGTVVAADGIVWTDFVTSLARCKPQDASTEFQTFETGTARRSWDSIGGYEELKKRLIRTAYWPLIKPQAWTALGVKPPGGVLLYGPSGCGKTALVQALASEPEVNSIFVKAPEIFSKYLGETEASLRRLFETARRLAPCIVCFDELDAIGTKRDYDDDSAGGVQERALSTLLNELDGMQERNGVMVIGCSNRPHRIDDALLRPGRLDHLIYISPPTSSDRLSILRTLTQPELPTVRKNEEKTPLGSDVDLSEISERTAGFTGADLTTLVREAGIVALREDMEARAVSKRHLDAVLVSGRVGRGDRREEEAMFQKFRERA